MKKVRLTSTAAGLALAVLTLPSTGAAQGASDENSKIRAGYALIEKAGLELNLKGKNPSLVGLGSYIVNAQADCNGCHGNPTFAQGAIRIWASPKSPTSTATSSAAIRCLDLFSCHAISPPMGQVVPPG